MRRAGKLAGVIIRRIEKARKSPAASRRARAWHMKIVFSAPIFGVMRRANVCAREMNNFGAPMEMAAANCGNVRLFSGKMLLSRISLAATRGRWPRNNVLSPPAACLYRHEALACRWRPEIMACWPTEEFRRWRLAHGISSCVVAGNAQSGPGWRVSPASPLGELGRRLQQARLWRRKGSRWPCSVLAKAGAAKLRFGLRRSAWRRAY